MNKFMLISISLLCLILYLLLAGTALACDPSCPPCFNWVQAEESCMPQCTGCESCDENGECSPDDDECPGECHECSVNGTCEDDTSQCDSCSTCIYGDCSSYCESGGVTYPCCDGNCCFNDTVCCGTDCIEPCNADECMQCDGAGGCESKCSTSQECCGGECVTPCSSYPCKECDETTGSCVDSCVLPEYCAIDTNTCVDCDSTISGDCSVSDEDVGFDSDNCASEATTGQCVGGLGGHILSYSQVSTDENVTGPDTEDTPGCADVTYNSCRNWIVGLNKIGFPVYNCVVDADKGLITENMGTHTECP